MRRPDSAALLDIAERVSRLPAYNAHRPDAFYENRDELAAELRAIARAITAAPVEAPLPGPSSRRKLSPRVVLTSLAVGRRTVMVVRRRPAFAL
jgi:hypothetical protein